MDTPLCPQTVTKTPENAPNTRNIRSRGEDMKDKLRVPGWRARR